MIDEFYRLRRPYNNKHLKYLYKFPTDSFSSNMLVRALHLINTLSYGDDGEINGLKKIGKDYCIVIQSHDIFGRLHGIKIIKRMNRFDHEYEIRIDSKYSHLRILFFTLPEIADSLFSEGIVLSFVIEKYGSSLNMNNVIDRLCEDAESVREIIYMDNYEEWLEEL